MNFKTSSVCSFTIRTSDWIRNWKGGTEVRSRLSRPTLHSGVATYRLLYKHFNDVYWASPNW